MIRVYAREGFYHISIATMMFADRLADQDNQVGSPGFRRHVLENTDASLLAALRATLRVPKIEAVLFGCTEGVSPHVDKLDSGKYGSMTLLLPLILPPGESILRVGDDRINLSHNIGYLFDHQIEHEVIHEHPRKGCTLLMAAELKDL